MDTKTGALRQLTMPEGGKWPAWSPDGQWLYFARSRPPWGGIWKMRSTGSAPLQITRGADDDIPQPSPDGKYVYYHKGWPGPMTVWRTPIDGGEETKIVDGVSPEGLWTVSPDGIYSLPCPTF